MLNKDLPATMHCDRFVVCFHCSGAGRGCNECSQEGYVAHDCPACVLIVIILAMKADNALAPEDVVFVNLAII